MGVRRLRVACFHVSRILGEGIDFPGAPQQPLRDAEVLDVRKRSRPTGADFIELLVESPTFDGPGSEGRWPQIAEDRWDEFPIHELVFELKVPPVGDSAIEDPDDRRGEIEGA